MIKGEWEYLQGIARLNLCAEHKTPLEVAWYDKEATHVLRCGKDHYPDTLVRNPSLTDEFRQGNLEDGPVADNVKKGIKTRELNVRIVPAATTFSGVPATDLGTGELIGLDMFQFLISYARGYHLDPARSHVVLMHGKPYITIDGYLFHANRSGIPYRLESRPMAETERTLYGIPEGAHAWIGEVIKDEGKGYHSGLGIVTREEMEAKSKWDSTKFKSPVGAAHPWQLAQKRAEWQALRRAFPIGESENKEEN